MSERRLRIVVCAVVMVLAGRRDGSAGIIEVIAEMSGPQMIGLLAECHISTAGTLDECAALGGRFAGPGLRSSRRLWLALDGGIYFSTGHDVDGQDYEFGKTWMLAFDPMLQMQTIARPRFAMYHGLVGASYNLLFGEGFKKFVNVGFKLRPIGVMVPIRGNLRLDVAYNLRIYPNGFTADQFGRLPIVPDSNKPETVHGVSIGVRF